MRKQRLQSETKRRQDKANETRLFKGRFHIHGHVKTLGGDGAELYHEDHAVFCVTHLR
jgi:hypothetical protein